MKVRYIILSVLADAIWLSAYAMVATGVAEPAGATKEIIH